jgi:diaminopimelate decarboxylase
MFGPMPGFHRNQQTLACDDVSIESIARAVGTPVHIYSAATLDARYRALDAAFADDPHRIHYALKANSTLAIASRLRALGAGADANSAGEIDVALRAGFAPADIVMTGVGKTHDELGRAVSIGVGAINIESAGEVDRLAALAAAAGRRARVAIRVNPDIDAGSHPHISTGLRRTKFGVPPAAAMDIARQAARQPALSVVGLHVHVGSQVTTAAPLARAATLLADLAHTLRADNVAIEHLDLGGGLGVAYEPGQTTIGVDEYAAAVLPAVRSTGLRLILEPGRWILAPAGILVAEVTDLKPGFVVTDAGMTDLLRPAMYGAWHGIEAVTPRPGPPIRTDVVGPVCETSDTLGHDRTLPPVEVGDLIAIRDTGAYGSVMASNYNRRPIAAEVLVDHGTWRLIRRRQTIDDLLQWDV